MTRKPHIRKHHRVRLPRLGLALDRIDVMVTTDDVLADLAYRAPSRSASEPRSPLLNITSR
jgi:hypothetical protein